MARELRRPKTGYEVLRRRFTEGRDDAGAPEATPPPEPESVPAPSLQAAVLREPAARQAPAAPVVLPEKETSELGPPAAPRPVERPAEARSAGKNRVRGSATSRRALIKFNLSAPAPGTSALYDQAAAAMGHRRTLPALVARAFEALEADLAAGRPVVHAEYPTAPGGHRTSSSRTLDAELLAKARRALDPFELLTPTAFGSLLAITALAGFLQRKSSTARREKPEV